LLSPPAGLPSAVAHAKKEVEQLLRSLETRVQDSRPDSVTDRFILYVKALQRDLGQWVSPQAFREIGSRAKLVRHLWHEHGELFPLVLCLFVEVELCRLQSMAKPNLRPLWNNKACAWLSGAEFVCDMALNHSDTGKQKQTAHFLRFYTGLGQVQLAFDVGDQAQASKSMQVVQQLANDVTASYGTGPVTETVGFLTSMNLLDSCVLAEEQCASSRQNRLLLGEQIAKEIFHPLPELEVLVRIQDQGLHACLGLLTTRFPNGFDGQAPFRR
jgi:hypothetical protein